MIGLLRGLGEYSNRFPMNPADAQVLQAEALRVSRKINFYLFLIIVIETAILIYR